MLRKSDHQRVAKFKVVKIEIDVWELLQAFALGVALGALVFLWAWLDTGRFWIALGAGVFLCLIAICGFYSQR